MKSLINPGAKLASLGLAKGLVRAAAVACIVVTWGVGSIEPSVLGFLGVSGLAVTAATPAQARCLLQGTIHNEIADNDCLEAQRTGCVRHMLSDDQYKSCLKANDAANAGGRSCIIGGIVHNELNDVDCAEAKSTGCVRRLLTDAQYSDCLSKQRH
jgi:hypothetical protein